MNYCLDTDIIIEFFRGKESVVQHMERKSNIYITYVTLWELFRGAYLSSHPKRELERIKDFIELCTILDFSMASCEAFAMISANLKKSGKSLNDADVLIGALALTHNCIVVTNNTKHFSRIPGLKLENWIK